jgi:hypothetical protein
MLWSQAIFRADNNDIVSQCYGAVRLEIIVATADAETAAMEKDKHRQRCTASSSRMCGIIDMGED